MFYVVEDFFQFVTGAAGLLSEALSHCHIRIGVAFVAVGPAAEAFAVAACIMLISILGIFFRQHP